jgi:O-antigen ligase
MIKLTDIIPGRDKQIPWLHWLTTLLFLALFAFPLLPLKVTNALLMAFSALTVIGYFIKPVPLGKALLVNLVFVVPFIPYLLEFFISGLDPVARFEVEKKLFFLTAPFVIPIFFKVTGFINYRLALLVFSLSVVLLTFYALVLMGIQGVPFSSSAYENGAFLLRDYFEKLSGLHPTYYALMALLAAMFIVHFPLAGKQGLRVSALIFAGILIICVLFLAARIALFAMLLWLLVWLIKLRTTLFRKLLLSLGSLALICIVILTVPSLNKRLSEFATWGSAQSTNENTATQRVLIMKCSMEVFSGNLVTGVGSRNFQQELNACYASKHWPKIEDQDFNPHNQYLSMGINYGLFVLLLFLGSLFLVFKKCLQRPEGVYFTIAILSFFLTESILERQMGVYLFGLLSLLFYNLREKTTSDS